MGLPPVLLEGGVWMARCIIIAPLYEGEEKEWLAPRSGDMIICADAGYRAAVSHGIRPDLTIGDFDSLEGEAEGNVIRLPVYKDDTDMVVCIREGRKRGYREFVLAGCLGGRFDHTIACLQCAADCAEKGEEVWLCDAQNRVAVLPPGKYVFPKVKGRKLSLLAYTPEVMGVNLHGTVWELEDAMLSSRYPLGCSNEWAGEYADLSFEEGLLTVCFSMDKPKHE